MIDSADSFGTDEASGAHIAQPRAIRGFSALMEAMERELRARAQPAACGKVQEVIGTLVRVSGLDATLGELCELRSPEGALLQRAEVVGFSRDVALLSPFGRLGSVSRATRVVGLRRPLSLRIGPRLLGRVIDSLGEPIDGKGPLECDEWQPVIADPPDPMSRPVVDTPMPTGVRVVDGMMTLAEGQRMGIFAPAGVGKSTLMGMFARGARCDVNVIALIGERGREVREFCEHILGPEGMARSVVVCATSDRSSIERAKAAYAATAVAEYFRDRGMRVLLMMDSLTRFARAQREIGLAMGEPPTRRGFPPSIFAELPRLLERAGRSELGSITALYTVLAEDESGGDPIAEEVRGILDGHMILSREIAAQNRYPAIDVLGSLSRVMTQVVPREHVAAAGHVRRLMAKHKEVELLLQVGEYQSGTDALADEAIAKIDAIRAFLGQPTDLLVDPSDTLAALGEIVQS
ncbi:MULTISPECIES: type III secretion system ATPase SctN [Burkholderia]|uniref:Type 3 secretion system ATPase n=1 Tax=Burkholderia anthinoferrum TaxID=3090833 RepID=A0ABU5WMW3_9BURK|nr:MULTISPECIES: type III secretion system ATPase SctN [Burkholderia]MEB2504157.1 type III secretion system ATPase SctN [Burkholderia anthinoferrum]MEB2530370.1 type III secretion system ATPase SctN [Burkholderia anthinoferrum]MEB2562912.1 type III secretion system ATPase SctN [Burkholderia anthinoferrum]MEB2580315.1 type III secretion system ATPase SctN [Burkholderia anthinoferrum]KVH04357.1 type III secretion apparatus H+-transporting two-sector ATPase [Burkholderia anthina]